LLAQERGLADGEAFVAGVLADLETSGLEPREKVLLRFVATVNEASYTIAPADMDVLHAIGWTDEAIYYAITVCALFNFYNRWIDAAGVHPLSDEAHREGAKRMAEMGYVRK
jgi:alkylhydroperoxidase family enzyme